MDSENKGAVVIGGGLAGLSTATFLARAGRPVVLFEQSSRVGGRAQTQDTGGFLLNMGLHALYPGGVGTRILRELGVSFTGGGGVPLGGSAIRRGEKYPLPAGLLSLLRTRLLGFPAKMEAMRLFRWIRRADPKEHQGQTVQEWLERSVRHPDLRDLIRALFRVVTYTDNTQWQSAGVALRQLQMAVYEGGVIYLDGGWQVLVDGLRRAALDSGAKIVTGAKVTAIEHDEVVRGVTLADGRAFEASSVVVATSPGVASEIVGGDETVLRGWADKAIPVKARCLDVALRRLPDPGMLFAIGIDRPIYFAVQSALAELAPHGGAVVHLVKYLDPAVPTDPKSDEWELDGLLETLQPGWQDVLVRRRYLPNMVVSNALVTAAQGGISGRPGPEVPGIRNLYVAGDWVGPEGWLSDPSFASAKRAAELIVRGSPASGRSRTSRRKGAREEVVVA